MLMTNNRTQPSRSGTGPSQTTGDQANAAPAPTAPTSVIPFIRATDENLQPGNLDQTRTLTATTQDLGIFDLPAYGYLAHLYIFVQATGGTAGLTNAVAAEDAPFNILRDIAVTEPNGAYIAQFTDGYQLYLANKYGGYNTPLSSDPKLNPLYSGVSTAGNFQFMLRIPISVSYRDGVGALANQDSAGQFKFRLKIGTSSQVYTTAPGGTLPSIRVRAWISGYDQPEASSGGVPNQTEPPAHGTTSFWSVQTGITVNSGQNVIPLLRKGNYLRQIIFVFRSGGARSTGDTNYPPETRFLRDSFPARYYDDNVWQTIMFERTGRTGAKETAGALDNGVRFHDYMHEFSGGLGYENRDLWQPTRGSTRLEIAGQFGASGTLDVLFNDVAIAQNVFL